MEARMSRGQGGGAGKPEVLRSQWRVFLGAIAFVAVSAPLGWLLSGWIVARTGLDPDLAIFLASVPAAAVLALGGKVLVKPYKDPHVSWLNAERMQAFERKMRPWGVAFLVILLLREFIVLLFSGVDMPLVADGAPFAWVFASVVLSFIPDLVQWGRGEELPLDEGVQAERQDAVRLGYLVVLALGVANVMLAGSWPLVAARAWVAILMLGVLVPQVRLMVLDRAAADGE